MYTNNPRLGLLRDGLSKPLIEKMQQALSVETALLNVLPSFAKASFSRELTSTFDLYAAQAEDHIFRLKKTCPASGGMRPPANFLELLSQACSIVESMPDTSIKKDAALISAAKKIVNHQIKFYDSLYALAADSNFGEVAFLMKNIVNCENERNRILSMLASSCKKQAANV